MAGSFTKNFIDFAIKHSNGSIRKNILRTALYAAKSVRETPGSYTYDVHQRMGLDNILPSESEARLANEVTLEKITASTDRIRVRIVYPSGTAWNCIGTVYEELCRDDRYQVVVITENYPNYIKVMADKGCTFIRLEDYDIKQDKPDILVLTSYSSTRPELNFPGVHDYVKTIISLFPNIVINEFDEKKHWQYVRAAYEFCTPDYYLFDSLVYNNCDGYIDKNKAVHMGHPQFDELYFRMQKASVDDPMWSKLEGKTVFLWATDHGLNEYYPIDALSIDLYIHEIIGFFDTHPEMGLIIRPHPYLMREMRGSGVFWTDIDFQRFTNYCKMSPNIVWDDSPDYCSAFKRCDAMLIDANCGFTVSFLATGKPMCRLLRNDMEVSLIHPELKDCYYYSKNFEDCKSFIENVSKGVDPLYSLRQEAFKSSIKSFDGLNGKRIKGFIDRILEEKHD